MVVGVGVSIIIFGIFQRNLIHFLTEGRMMDMKSKFIEKNVENIKEIRI
jgi:hypothetical protein